MRNTSYFLLLLLIFANMGSSQIKLTAILDTSIEQPVGLYPVNDESGRLFALSQPGKVYILLPSSSGEGYDSQLFLDITSKVDYGGEKGLLGFALDPNFNDNGLFYLDYTTRNPLRTIISKWELDSEDKNRADPNSEDVLLTIDQPFGNHNGGQIAFGPDGFLYIALGDGGSAGDPQGNGQNLKTLLASILRIDVTPPGSAQKYAIPSDNPLKNNDQGYRPELYAWGLRNPWRFSFDPETQQLWAGDVGQNRLEEIDIITKGGNYGWNIMEGTDCYPPGSDCDQDGLILPIWEYPHENGNRSITGGFVYRGSTLPSLVGAYIYADYVSGRIWALHYTKGEEPINELLMDTNLLITSFGVDQQNELYLTAFDGNIYKLEPTETGIHETQNNPSRYTLYQNFPNPFNAKTVLQYEIETDSFVEITIYDRVGRKVRTLVSELKKNGIHRVSWNGTNIDNNKISSGVYFYQLKINGNLYNVKKMVFLE